MICHTAQQRGAKGRSGVLEEPRNQTACSGGPREERVAPVTLHGGGGGGHVLVVLVVLVVLGTGRRRGFAHDAVYAERTRGLGLLRGGRQGRAELRLLFGVFGCSSGHLCVRGGVTKSSWSCGVRHAVVGRRGQRGHPETLLEGDVLHGAHLSLDAVHGRSMVGSIQAGVKQPSDLSKLGVVPLEALPPPEKAAVVEHVLGGRVQGPVVALAGVPWLPGDLDEAVVEGQVVPDGVLPGGELLLVVGELAADEVADAAQGQLLLRVLQDGHGDEGDVGVGGLHRDALPRSPADKRRVWGGGGGGEAVLALPGGGVGGV